LPTNVSRVQNIQTFLTETATILATIFARLYSGKITSTTDNKTIEENNTNKSTEELHNAT